jgi:Protein of unknown function (DUF3015)
MKRVGAQVIRCRFNFADRTRKNSPNLLPLHILQATVEEEKTKRGGNEMIRGQWFRLGVALLPLCATQVWADHPDTGPGCGLGKLAWSDYGRQRSIAPQVMMATTNGTFGSQTFGITSGTSGCTNDGTIMAQYKVDVFAAVNYDNLSQEMAQGGGEHLTSLAELMGISEEQRSDFFALAQARFASLIQSGDATPAAMIKTLQSGMAMYPALRNSL